MGDNYKPYESTINIDWHYSITLNMIEGVIIVCPNTRLDKQITCMLCVACDCQWACVTTNNVLDRNIFYFILQSASDDHNIVHIHNNIMWNISHDQSSECEEYFAQYCESHGTLLWD